MTVIDPTAASIAAEKAGLSEEEVARAVAAYRAAATRLHDEPAWQAETHMSGPAFGHAVYFDEGTEIKLAIESWKERGEWKQEQSFVFRGRAYEHFGEARELELREQTADLANVVSLHVVPGRLSDDLR